jgi:hypothetical protein
VKLNGFKFFEADGSYVFEEVFWGFCVAKETIRNNDAKSWKKIAHKNIVENFENFKSFLMIKFI